MLSCVRFDLIYHGSPPHGFSRLRVNRKMFQTHYVLCETPPKEMIPMASLYKRNGSQTMMLTGKRQSTMLTYDADSFFLNLFFGGCAGATGALATTSAGIPAITTLGSLGLLLA